MPRVPVSVPLRRLLTGVRLGVVLLLGSAPALADVSKQQCIDANTLGQNDRREGKLAAAKEQLRTCADSSCPALVRDDCTKRLDELDRAQPTVAFGVKDASGADLTAVRVSMDGRVLADRLDGTALPVDIGPHVFTFEIAGRPPITRNLVMTEGEKGRRERIVIDEAQPQAGASPLGTAAPASVPASAPIQTEPRSAGGGMGAQKVLGLVAGGVGAVGIGLGSVFGVMTVSQKNQQQSACASLASCTSAGHAEALNDHSSAMSDATISTVAFVAGGVLLAGGALLFFTGGHSSEQQAAAGAVVVPSVGPEGAGMLVRGEF
jgi:hypothetical protein